MLFLFISKSNLNCIIAVSFDGLFLGYHARARFNNGHGSLPPISIENAGHANLFSNNTFHFCFIILSGTGLRYMSVTIFYKNLALSSPSFHKGRPEGGFYALISTSTPEGKSNFESASTVLELLV